MVSINSHFLIRGATFFEKIYHSILFLQNNFLEEHRENRHLISQSLLNKR